jgi:hypothetical protein
VRYLTARPTLDAKQAAKRITAPNLAYVAPEPVDTTPTPPATDPVVADPATIDPVAAAPTTPTTPAG